MINGGKRVGNSDVWYLAEEDQAYISVPVPPSTNRRQTIGYRKVRSGKAGFAFSTTKNVLVKTDLVKGHEAYIPFIRVALKNMDFHPINDYAKFDFWFFLKNPRYDTHNGLKVMCDMLEKAGAVTNDRFILPNVHMPELNVKIPCLHIGFPR